MVEDEAEVRAVAGRFLAALGCEVTACAMAEEALAQLRADGNEPPFDLLLTDIALGPGMRGTELAQEVRQRWPRLAILLVSGYSSGALNTPLAWPLLSKPYSREALARAIVRALR